MAGTRVKNKKTWKNSLLNYFSIFVIIVLFALSIHLWVSKPLDTKILDVKFMVGNTSGFDLNTSVLAFGRIMPGSSAARNVKIENSYEFPVEVFVLISEDIADFVRTDAVFTLAPGEKKSVSVTLAVPMDMSYGNYTGKIKFEFREA